MSNQEIKHYEIIAAIIVLVALLAYTKGYHDGRSTGLMEATNPPSKHQIERLEP